MFGLDPFALPDAWTDQQCDTAVEWLVGQGRLTYKGAPPPLPDNLDDLPPGFPRPMTEESIREADKAYHVHRHELARRRVEARKTDGN